MRQKFKDGEIIWANILNRYIGPIKVITFDQFNKKSDKLYIRLPTEKLMIDLFPDYIDEFTKDIKAFHGIPIDRIIVSKKDITIINQ